MIPAGLERSASQASRFILSKKTSLANGRDVLGASIGNAHDFKNGRQLAAWLGLTPSQYSSGGKSKLGKITKAGDAYLRTLLVQGARSVIIGAENRTDSFSRWVCSLIGRRGYWRAVVAIAA